MGRTAVEFRTRRLRKMLLHTWYLATQQSLRDKALVSKCFDAWAWHPDGALMQKMAREFLR